jgi:hypothetical protein
MSATIAIATAEWHALPGHRIVMSNLLLMVHSPGGCAVGHFWSPA